MTDAQHEQDLGDNYAEMWGLALCRYCRSREECRGSAWTTEGQDLEAFERNHTLARRNALKAARRYLKGEK